MNVKNVIDSMYQYRYESEKAQAVDTCIMCGYKVHEGEYFYQLNEECICDECILEYLKEYREMR